VTCRFKGKSHRPQYFILVHHNLCTVLQTWWWWIYKLYIVSVKRRLSAFISEKWWIVFFKIYILVSAHYYSFHNVAGCETMCFIKPKHCRILRKWSQKLVRPLDHTALKGTLLRKLSVLSCRQCHFLVSFGLNLRLSCFAFFPGSIYFRWRFDVQIKHYRTELVKLFFSSCLACTFRWC